MTEATGVEWAVARKWFGPQPSPMHDVMRALARGDEGALEGTAAAD